MVLRAETRARARALQVLYAWDVKGHPAAGDPLNGLASLPTDAASERARGLVSAVVTNRDRIDREITGAADRWRLERIGTVERNILRLATQELLAGEVPGPVVIDEAVRLARWFAGSKAPAFVNGVLDALARRLGRL